MGCPTPAATPAASTPDETAKEEDVTMTNVIGALVSQVRHLLRLRVIERYAIVAVPSPDPRPKSHFSSSHTFLHLSMVSG